MSNNKVSPLMYFRARVIDMLESRTPHQEGSIQERQARGFGSQLRDA